MEKEFYLCLNSKNKQLKEDLVEVFFNRQFIKIEYGKVLEGDERSHGKKFSSAEDAYRFLFERGLVTDIVFTLPLLGIAEFADFLGIPSTKFSSMYSKQRKGEVVNPPLPMPIQVIAATSIWTMKQASDYKAEFEQYKPTRGRPTNTNKNEKTPVE